MGFYWCADCDTHEILGDPEDPTYAAKLYPDEIETGWYRPSEFAGTPLKFTRIGSRYKEEELPF